ncbi:MAG: ABC transporter permease [Pseudonocardia sp.]|nr:ABC transporter permease [Pseudonocardia sp.]
MGALLADVAAWFGDSANWTGAAGVPNRVLEHLQYSIVPILLALLIAVPIGAAVGHSGRGGFLVVGVANGMRSLPELGVLTILVTFMSVGLLPVTIALLILAIPPLLAGTYAGVSNVDRAVVDAARGMGMTEPEILTKVELPNALPLIIGGLRTATLQVIATAAIAAFVGVDGLGRILFSGLAVRDYTRMAAGALLIAVLALLADAALAALQRLIVSPGLRTSTSSRRRAVVAPAQPEQLPQSRSTTPEPELARS